MKKITTLLAGSCLLFTCSTLVADPIDQYENLNVVLNTVDNKTNYNDDMEEDEDVSVETDARMNDMTNPGLAMEN